MPKDKGFSSYNYGTMENNFFDASVDVSNQTTGLGATAKTTAEMKNQSTFTDAGWDFASIWRIDPDYNDGYPGFSYQIPLIPLNNWAIYLGILLIGAFLVVRYTNIK